MSEVTVQLSDPVEHGSETITSITLKKPKVKILKGLTLPLSIGDESGITIPLVFNDLMTLAARMSGQSTAVIEELGFEDAAKIGEAVMNFLPSSIKGGATGSSTSPDGLSTSPQT